MPENASTRTIDRDRLRSRLVSPRSTGKRTAAAVSPSGVSPGRPAQFEQSPVLFRLPAIAPAAAIDVSVSNDVTDMSEPPRSGPSHGMQGEPSELRSEFELRRDDELALDIASVESPAHFQPPGQQTPSQLSTEAAVNSSQLSPASPVESSPGESVQVAAATAVEASSEQRRTWWEHWSSGVVLILLVIALVVASIIAFNDGGAVKSGQMAGQLEASMLDEFDLSSIAIPDISMPPLSDSASRPLSAVAQDATSPSGAAQSPSATESVVQESVAVDLVAADKAAVEKTATDRAEGEKVVEPEQLVGGGDLVPGTAGQAAAELSAPATPEPIPPLPLATLDRPTEVAAPQLFAQDKLPGEPGSSASTNRISTLPASNPTVSLELPQTEAMQVDGSSPTFYDGASIAGGQHTDSGAAGPVDTNMPSISTVLASATASVDSGNAPAAQVVTSATPDLNGESIVEAYLRFQKLHQATTGPTTNRYPAPPLPQ